MMNDSNTPYTSPRHAAVEVLCRLHQQDGYSNIMLDDLLERLTFSSADRGLIVRLVYGVIEHRLTIDYLLNHLSSVPVKKMDDRIREILRIAVYQMVYMDRIPDFAAIDGAVELTKRCKRSRLSGFVNAVLRSVQRESHSLLDALPETDKGIEIRYSCPREWIRVWRDAYGDTTLNGMMTCLNEVPPAYVRVNTMHTDVAAFTAALIDAGIGFRTVEGLPEALQIESPALLREQTQLTEKDYYFQDIASQWCCRALDARPGERIADVCAAPGGKSMTVAQYMQGVGHIEAGELHSRRCEVMTERVRRAGLDLISVTQRDATQSPDEDSRGTFDRVMCDAPCSGLGVIRRRPEIRYKTSQELSDLPAVQFKILSQAAELVRPGGILQYSTCTVRPEENEQIAEAFLRSHPDFSPRLLPIEPCFAKAGLPVSHQITLFPHIHESDGFFIAGFIRNS